MTAFSNSKADVLKQRLDMGSEPVILPNLTTAERDALAGITDGMLVYNATTDKIQGRANSAWVDLHA